MERPLFFPLFSMIAGLYAGLLFSRFVPPPLFIPLLLLAVCAVFWKSRTPLQISLSLLLFCAANVSLKPFIDPDFSPAHIARSCCDEPVVIEGVLDSRPESSEHGCRLLLRAERIFADKAYKEVTGRLLLSVKKGDAHFVTGDRVRFASRLRRPRNYGLPGEYDVERHLAFRNIFVTAFVKSSDEIIFIGVSGEFALQRRVDAIATHLGEFIGENVPPAEGAILRALLLGDMGVVPKVIKDAYTRTGVNHILSISGFHVGIIAVFIFQLLLLTAKGSECLLLHLNMRRFSMLLTLPFLVFYLFLSGAAPATVRSVIMIGVYILAMFIEREVDPIDSLMLAAVLILAGSPTALFDLSFQLSFLAFWGILVLTPVFAAPFGSIQGRTMRKILLFFMASAAATVATILPVAYYFHRTTLTGLISNFFIVPLLGYGAVVIGFTALPFVYLAPFIAKLLFLVAAFLVKTSNSIIMFLAKIPTLPLFNPSLLDLAIFYLFMLAITFSKGARIRRICCISLAALFILSGMMHGAPDKGKLKLTIFSIGQGESILIDFPDGKRMLVDGGGSPGENAWDVGERLLAPALWKLGIERLDYMVLTHPHPDHMQGLNYVAANFTVGEFWDGGSYPESREYLELMEVLRRRRVPVRRISAASAPIELGGVRIEPLAPFPRTLAAPPVDFYEMNDESLVFRLKAGDFAVLLTGDIGSNIEERLAAHPELLRCTVLKLPHHGSRYSSSMAFLKAVAPQIAVVSAGYGNSFHLPAQETLDRLQRLGIRLYRTDLDGTIQVVCENERENAVTIRTAGHFR
ncbi:MAG TPA: DNA internalization-related competence protein ComEC/Rec2 [Geobacteraceae bacterium]|nr:DNA internalization-related competence protein ComEC/Rec2 [Geobacteraceae bacterium]